MIVIRKGAVPPPKHVDLTNSIPRYSILYYSRLASDDFELVILMLQNDFSDQEIADSLVHRNPDANITKEYIVEVIDKARKSIQENKLPEDIRANAFAKIDAVLWPDEFQLVELLRIEGTPPEDHVRVKNLRTCVITDVNIGEYLMDQDQVRKKMNQEAYVTIVKMKQRDWDGIVKLITDNFRHVKTDPMASRNTRMMEYVKDFLRRGIAEKPSEIDSAFLGGMPFYHGTKKEIALNTPNLARHINTRTSERVSPKSIGNIFKLLDFKHLKMTRTVEGVRYTYNFWLIPQSAVEDTDGDGTMDDGATGDGQDMVDDEPDTGGGEETRADEGTGDLIHEGGGTGTNQPTGLGDGRIDGGNASCNMLSNAQPPDDSGNEDFLGMERNEPGTQGLIASEPF